MAMDVISKTLFGDTERRGQLEDQISALEEQIKYATGQKLQELTAELDGLKGRLAEQMRAQGATDAQGRLLAAKDVQSQYLDTDYLNLRKQQAKDVSGQQLAQSLRLGKQMKLQGAGTYNPYQIASSLEQTQRANQTALAGDVRGETLRAKGEAGTELGRKQQYATQLTDYERQNLMDRIANNIQNLNITASQKAALSEQLASMPDGALNQLAQMGGKALLSYATGGLSSILEGGATLGDVLSNTSNSFSRLFNTKTTKQINDEKNYVGQGTFR